MFRFLGLALVLNLFAPFIIASASQAYNYYSVSNMLWSGYATYCQNALAYIQTLQQAAVAEYQRKLYSWKELRENESLPNQKDDYEFLAEKKRRDSHHNVASIVVAPEIVGRAYYEAFKTRVYYTATGKVAKNGHIPTVDPMGKGLVVILSGAGTETAGGASGILTANKWASLGYPVLMFDFPFHKEGATSEYLKQADAFITWVYTLIKRHQVKHLPTTLVGHSFGSKLVWELLARDPFLVDHVQMSSPGPLDKTMMNYFQAEAEKIKQRNNIRVNEKGSEFVRAISDGFITNNALDDYTYYQGVYLEKSRLMDPTLRNPKLKFYFIIGNKDEFVPPGYDIRGTVAKFAANAKVEIIPDAGHMIWIAKDAQGNDIMTKYMLEMNGEDIRHEKQIKAAVSASRNYQAIDFLLQAHLLDLNFRAWFKRNYRNANIHLMAQSGHQENAAQILASYQTYLGQRENEMIQNMLANSEFSKANQKIIDQMGKKSFQKTQLFGAYFKFLSERR